MHLPQCSAPKIKADRHFSSGKPQLPRIPCGAVAILHKRISASAERRAQEVVFMERGPTGTLWPVNDQRAPLPEHPLDAASETNPIWRADFKGTFHANPLREGRQADIEHIVSADCMQLTAPGSTELNADYGFQWGLNNDGQHVRPSSPTRREVSGSEREDLPESTFMARGLSGQLILVEREHASRTCFTVSRWEFLGGEMSCG